MLLGWVVASWQLSLGWTLGLQLAYLLAALALVLLVLWWWRGGRAARDKGVPVARQRALLAANAAGIALFALVGLAIGRVYLRVADAFPSARRGPEIVAASLGRPARVPRRRP